MAEALLQFIRQAGVGIVISDCDGNIPVANARFWEIAGRRGSSKRHDLQSLCHPDDLPAALDAVRRVIEGEREVQVECRWLRGDASATWTRMTLTPIEGSKPGEVLAMAVIVDITDERAERERNRAAERRYRALVDATGGTVWTSSPRGEPLEPNPNWTDLTGQDEKSLADGGWLESVHPDDREVVSAIWARALADGSSSTWQFRMRRKDGTYRWMLVRSVPIHDENGELLEFVGTLTDIEDVRKADEERQTSAAMIDAVMSSSPIAIAFLDSAGRYVRLNAAMAAFAGRSVEEHIGKSVAEMQPRLWETEEAHFRQVLETGQPVSEHLVEGRVLGAEGESRHWLTSYFPVPGVPASTAGVAVVAIEVTSRINAEQALARSESRLRALLEATPAMVVVATAGGRAIFTNRAWEEFTGLKAADGAYWAERGYIHEDDLERATAAWKKARETGEGYDIDYRVRNVSGTYCWVAFQIRPVKDESGRVVSWTSAAIEIDERVRTQEALVASEARLRALIDATPAMVVVTDATGEVQIASQQWTAFTGLDAGAMVRWRDLDTIHPDDAAATAEVRREGLFSRQGYDVDYRLRRVDGEYRWVSASVRPALDADGRVLGWMFVALDVDQRVRARENLENINADLRQLAESIPAIVITSPEDPAQPAFANRYWSEYTGLPLEEVTPESTQRLIHRDDAPRVLEAYERAGSNRDPYEIEFRLRRHDGVYRWHVWRTQPLVDAEQRYLGWITAGVDIDDQVRLRQALEQTNQHLQILAEAGSAIAGAVDYDAAVEAAAEVLVPTFAAWCSVDILEGDGVRRKLAVHADDVAPETAEVLRLFTPDIDDRGAALTGVLRSGEGVFFSSMPRDLSVFGRDPEHRAALESLAPNSWISVPLRAVGGRTLGALSLVRRGDETPFNDQDFATVLELGRRLAAALDRSRLFAQVARALGNLRLLADAGLALSGSRELEEALEGATRLLVPGYADWCTVDLVEGDNIRRATLAHSERVNSAAAEVLRRLHVSRTDRKDATARILATGEPLFLPQIDPDHSHVANRSPEFREAARLAGGRSAIGVPLRAGDTIFGVLGLVRVEGREPFDESDLALSRELGRQLGGWIERGRLFSDLRQALSAKDEFFGFVSHELKTPLTTVVGVSDVLQRRYEELEEDQRQDAISLVRRDSLRLEEIIANMLTLARSERQTGDEPALVQHVIASALAIFRQRHPHREVVVRSGQGLSPVLAPSGWLDRVVENLLSNAEKYSESGPIEVEAEQVGDTVEVRVLDRGRGVSEEQMREVFEPFFRADPNEPGVSGVGLGLTVCRRLIERLGGEVWLGPREGGGTVAGFRLPVMDVPEE